MAVSQFRSYSAILVVLGLMLLIEGCQCQTIKLNSVTIPSYITKIKELITYYMSQQPVIIQTAIKKFFEKKTKEFFDRGLAEYQVVEKLKEFISKTDGIQKQIDDFMKDTMGIELGLSKLSKSFLGEIFAKPAEYFLNYKMFDLLFD